MAAVVKKYPGFFTIFLPLQHSHTMKVPKEFLKNLHEDLSSNAVLSSSSSGDKWQVSVLKKGSQVYIQNGWPQFVTDNSIVLHDVLIFTYHGENCFHVQIFDKNGVERLCLKEKTQEQAAIPEKTTNVSKCRKKDMPCGNKGFIFTGCETMQTRQKQTATPSLARTKKNKERQFSPGKSHQEDLSPPKDFPTPQHSVEIESSEALKLAESFTSSKPYWKNLMTKCHVKGRCILPIATKFARRYIPEEVKQMHIGNSEGTLWKVHVSWSRGYAHFGTGWANFVRDNKLMRGDTCIFELEENLHFRVHIFRTRCAPS